MTGFFSSIFDTSDFPARWECGQWTSFHGWLHILSDSAIFGAYFAIPAIIAYFVARRKDVSYPKVYWIFALFIFSCGLTHLLDATIFWHPWYRLSGVVKFATAVISWTAVGILIRTMPEAVRLPGVLRLNEQLQREVDRREKAERYVRELNEELQSRVSELETLLEVLPLGIAIAKDPECRIIRTNDEFARLLRIPKDGNASLSAPDDAKPGHFHVLAGGRELRGEDLPIQKSASTGEVVRDFEIRVVFDDGDTTDLLAYTAPLGSVGDGIQGAVGAFVDITQRKSQEAERAAMLVKMEESQKLESLGVMAGGIAHDFNNLLTGVMGNASLAKMDVGKGSPVEECLTEIENAATSAADLCRQLLAYAGKGKFVVESIDLTTLIRDTAVLLRSSIEKKNCSLDFRLSENLPMVSADPSQIRQIVMNLLINGVEATESKEGVILIRTGTEELDADYFEGLFSADAMKAGRYVFIEVSDNGCGMGKDTLERIFNPFFTTKFTGRGLGLSAVLGIVRNHGGAMNVYSEPGQGTTFKVIFPACGATLEAMPQMESDPAILEKGIRVLVIDDEATVRTVVERCLRAYDFEILTAVDGVKGVEVFRENRDRIDVVLLDLTMPRKDGIETFKDLREIRPDVNIVLMSGFNRQDAINQFVGQGLAEFLQKPFKKADLLEALRKAVQA